MGNDKKNNLRESGNMDPVVRIFKLQKKRYDGRQTRKQTIRVCPEHTRAAMGRCTLHSTGGTDKR